jgi:hypothetical protein
MLVGTSNRSESLTLANARRPRTSYLIHLQVLYCHTCGCADRTSARIRIKSGRRLGAVPRSARPRCQSANVSRALNRLRHSYASTSRCSSAYDDLDSFLALELRTEDATQPITATQFSSPPEPILGPSTSRDLVSARRGRGQQHKTGIR